DMKGRKNFNLKIADGLSGIATWRGTLDGKWILLEYEPKTKTITHTFDKHTSAPGTKKFEVVVTDERGNTARYSSTFTHLGSGVPNTPPHAHAHPDHRHPAPADHSSRRVLHTS